jgi:hypothetical protein
MRYGLLSTVAAAALAAGMATAGAQMPDKQRMEPGSQSGGAEETQKSPRQVGPAQSAPAEAQESRGQAQDLPQGSAQTQDSGKGEAGKNQDLSTTQKQDPMPRAQDQGSSKQRTTGTQQREPRGQALDQRTPQAKQPGAAQKRDDMSGETRGQARTQQPGRMDSQSDTQARTGDAAAAKLSERQQTTIQQSFQRERNLNVVSRSDINVSISIGATIPRSVRLVPLPASIIAVVPQFRSYHYVVIEDEVVIVHPRTYRVVHVIPLRGAVQARATGGSEVRLSSAQRSRILTYARSECETVLAEPSFPLTVGAVVPSQIELCPFEDVIVSEVDVVQPYRFFMVRDQVVLVDPREHRIVEVIR